MLHGQRGHESEGRRQMQCIRLLQNPCAWHSRGDKAHQVLARAQTQRGRHSVKVAGLHVFREVALLPSHLVAKVKKDAGALAFHQKFVAAYLVDASIEGYPAGRERQVEIVMTACLLGVLLLTMLGNGTKVQL